MKGSRQSKEISIFSWLHMSDLHCAFDSNNTADLNDLLGTEYIDEISEETTLSQAGLRAVLCKNPIDCIILSGDIMEKGQTTNVDATKDCIKKIYMLGEDLCNWKKSEVKSRLFYCPGNHDLNRNACTNRDGSNINRRSTIEALRQLPNYLRNGVFVSKKSDKDAYSLLTDNTFHDFDGIFKEAIQEIMEQADKEDSQDIAHEYDYEYRLYKAIGHVKHKVFCLGLNTALFAGQTRKKENNEDFDALEQLFYARVKAEREIDHQKKQKLLSEYEKLRKKYNSEIPCDYGHLCTISMEAKKDLQDRIQNEGSYKRIVIAFGHHPMDWLSKNAMTSLIGTLGAINCQFYLCGHTHIPERINKKHENNNKTVKEIQIGALKRYGQSDNVGSFSIGKIIRKDDNYTVIITKYLYVKTSLGYAWITHTNEPYSLTVTTKRPATTTNRFPEKKNNSKIKQSKQRYRYE